MSMAKEVKYRAETLGLARGGVSFSRGVLWQSKRVNARPHPIFVGKLIAEERCPRSGFQTDALYLYADGSMLVVHREADPQRVSLAATN
jgi:hypothetical protein